MYKKILLLCLIISRPLCSLDRKSSAPYISGDTFRHYSDFVLDQDSTFDPRKVTKPSIIFVKTDYLEAFFKNFHPKIKPRYILITHNYSDPHCQDTKMNLFRSHNYLQVNKIIL